MNQGHAFINSHLVLVADRNIPGVDFLVSAMVNYIKSTVHLSQHYVFDHISSLRQIHECPCSKLIRKSPSYLWIINEIVINRLVQICRPRACWAWTIRKKWHPLSPNKNDSIYLLLLELEGRGWFHLKGK